MGKPAEELSLGRFRWDISRRALVVGILNRTTDSFYDKGAYFHLEQALRRAEEMVKEGADLIDVGGVKAGEGPTVSLEEELDRVLPAVEAVVSRFEVAVSVDTWRAKVAAAAFEAGAVLGNDISGFSDPDYLKAAAAAGAGVVATHIRLSPRVPDPSPYYEDVVGEVCAFLASKAAMAVQAGVGAQSVIIDAGLDLGKTTQHSLALLRSSHRLAELGWPLLLSASRKDFLGELFALEVEDRKSASLAAASLGVWRGARLLRVHDVAETRRARDALAGIGSGR